jgi:hypothetical protein
MNYFVHLIQPTVPVIFETKLEKTLSEKDKSICDGEITVTECSDAVNEITLYLVDVCIIYYILYLS